MNAIRETSMSPAFAMPYGLLSQVDGGNPLWNQEWNLATDQIISEALKGTEEPEPMGKPVIKRGGVMHRFSCDRAIYQFCRESYLSKPRTMPNGLVTAWDYDEQARVAIGWIF